MQVEKEVVTHNSFKEIAQRGCMEELVFRTYFLPIVLGLLPLVLNFYISSLRKSKEESRQLRYLVVRVASMLEAFSLDSFNLFVNYQLHRITSGKVGTNDKGVPCELLEFPNDVDWQVLDAKLVNEILSFPNRLKISRRQVEYSKQRYEEEDFERVRFECLTQLYETGQEAWGLAKKLREQVGSSV